MLAPSPVEISLTDQTGRTLRVVGRAAEIIAIIAADQVWLNDIRSGHVRVDFGSGGCVYEGTKVERR